MGPLDFVGPIKLTRRYTQQVHIGGHIMQWNG
jgi:hypothetical protein